MKTSETIIVGIDFSESTPLVLRHAIQTAGSGGARLIAVHVLEKSRQDFMQESGVESSESQTLKDQAEKRFEKLVSGKSQDVDLEFVVKSGKPAEELCRLADEANASFLIVSANDLTKKRLGSVAARCVRVAPCDVLILRDWQGAAFGKIVVCTDFSGTADLAVERAALVARGSDASLEILHVMYPPDRDSWGEVLEHAADSATTYPDECRSAVKARMEDYLKKHAVDLEGLRYEAVVLESQMPSVAITDHVKDIGADLVVMGTHGHSAFASHFLGTNAERLIQDAPVSVFAVR